MLHLVVSQCNIPNWYLFWCISVRWISRLTCKIIKHKKSLNYTFSIILYELGPLYNRKWRKKNLDLKQIHFIFNDRVRKIKTRNDCFLMKPKLHMMSDVMTNVNLLKIYLVFSSTVWWFLCSGFVYFHTVTECMCVFFFFFLALLILEW